MCNNTIFCKITTTRALGQIYSLFLPSISPYPKVYSSRNIHFVLRKGGYWLQNHPDTVLKDCILMKVTSRKTYTMNIQAEKYNSYFST